MKILIYIAIFLMGFLTYRLFGIPAKIEAENIILNYDVMEKISDCKSKGGTLFSYEFDNDFFSAKCIKEIELKELK